MKKLFLIAIFSLFIIKANSQSYSGGYGGGYSGGYGGGQISLGLNKNLTTHSFSLRTALNINEKLYRRTFYSANIGFSRGLNNDYDSSINSFLFTSHGVRINFTDDFTTALRIGIQHNSSSASTQKNSGYISLDANLRLWK